jgi:hypothetical protein
MRAYVKEQGLDVKTSGKGRNKATILADLQALWSSGAPASVDTPGAAEAVAGAAAEEDAAPAAEAAATAGAAPATAPDGFEWGLTF